MDKKEAYDPARDDVGRLINKISHQLKRQMCFHQEESELTNMQKRVLHYILFQSLKKDIYQKDIEKEFQIRRSTATGILQLLEKNGFVIRETVEWDARLKKLVPTDMRVCMRVLEQMSTNLLGNEKNNRGEEKQNHE